jgi:cob(I)alamin adenosyltransferase
MDIHMAQQGLEAFREAMRSEVYDLSILDETNMALAFELLEIEEVVEAIEGKPVELHLVLTRRDAKKRF